MPSFDDEVLEHLHAVMSAFKSHMHQAMRQNPNLLAPMEARALGFFARHPGSTSTDLVQHARRDKAQVTRLVKGLLERGLLERAPDETDRRSHRLRLTDSGRAVQRTMLQQRKRFAAGLTAPLDEAERAQLVNLLAKLRAGVQPAE